MASLLDGDGRLLETKVAGITGTLNGETAQTSTIQFSKLGSQVVVHAAAAGEDQLIFEGLPVSLEQFTADASGTLTCSLSGVSVYSTLVTAISGSGEKITINGAEFTGSGSLSVPIGTGETVINVTIGDTAYALHITSTHASGGSGGSSYQITVTDSENGTVTATPANDGVGTTVTLTAAPDKGYRLAGLTVTNRGGNSIPLHDQGNGQYTFTMPTSPVTVKAVFAPIGWATLPFVDVPADAYFYDAVGWAVSNDITNGTTDTTFSPNATVTRGQTVAFLWRYAGAPEAGGTSFTDVSADAYYAAAVAWAAGKGITSGTTATTFNPNDPCTRAQIVTFLYRAQ